MNKAAEAEHRSQLLAARLFAKRWHRGQKYGDVPFIKHLLDTERIICGLGFAGETDLRVAALLHDVLEDTGADCIDLLRAGFSLYAVALVDAVTDEPGTTRARRKHKTYPKIYRMHDAVTLKVADRIANISACAAGSDKLEMYLAEHAEFSAALCHRGAAVAWDKLEQVVAEKTAAHAKCRLKAACRSPKA